jgi:hypothetical protein
LIFFYFWNGKMKLRLRKIHLGICAINAVFILCQT